MSRRFVDAYRSWMDQPFPDASTDEAVDDIHKDLVLVDDYVANEAIPWTEEGLRTESEVDVSGAIAELKDRILELQATAPPQEADQLGSYLEYLEKLREVDEALTEEWS
jgi:hypothetical protein